MLFNDLYPVEEIHSVQDFTNKFFCYLADHAIANELNALCMSGSYSVTSDIFKDDVVEYGFDGLALSYRRKVSTRLDSVLPSEFKFQYSISNQHDRQLAALLSSDHMSDNDWAITNDIAVPIQYHQFGIPNRMRTTLAIGKLPYLQNLIEQIQTLYTIAHFGETPFIVLEFRWANPLALPGIKPMLSIVADGEVQFRCFPTELGEFA